jgi:hypothetical protein
LFASNNGRVIVNDPKTGKSEKDQHKALAERVVPDQIKKIIQHQEKRKILPKFPDAYLVKPKIETITITPEEKEYGGCFCDIKIANWLSGNPQSRRFPD